VVAMRRLQIAAMTGQIRDLRADRPEGMAASRERLLELIGAWSQRTSVPISKFVLGGFSQGSMLATDVTLHLDENPAGLIVLSGSLLNEVEWRKLALRRRDLRVLQTHGLDDPIVPYAGAEALRDLWQEVGATVDFVPFRGGHGIPLDVFNRVAVTLEGLASITD
jgi:phospholipase/carboxylesterase